MTINPATGDADTIRYSLLSVITHPYARPAVSVDSGPLYGCVFHELNFRHKPAIYFFSDPETYAARSISSARLCAFFNGNVVVSPRARIEDATGVISLKTYLIHELSHSFLYQNSTLTGVRYPEWLLEGFAMFSASQMGTSFFPTP